MFRAFISVIIAFGLGPKSATAQTLNSPASSASREQILRQVSKERLSIRKTETIQFKISITDRQPNLPISKIEELDHPLQRPSPSQHLLKGGESGGGGHLLEKKVAASIQRMYDGLKIKNRDNINLETLRFFIENTTFVLSNEEKEFYLKKDVNSDRNELRDAVNYFPKQWLLKLYTPAWEKYFALNMDTEDLLYHEFLLFFFVNDKDYSRSKLAGLGSSKRSLLTLVIGSAQVRSDDSSIFVDAETLDRRERMTVYCTNQTNSPDLHFYYFRNGQAVAHTNNSTINPFHACDDFEDMKSKLLQASPTCPAIVDLDRQSADSGYISVVGIRNTCSY